MIQQAYMQSGSGSFRGKASPAVDGSGQEGPSLTLYNNQLFTDAGDVLGHAVDDMSCAKTPKVANSSPVPAKLQQQKVNAANRRMERLQSFGIAAISTESISRSSRPGTPRQQDGAGSGSWTIGTDVRATRGSEQDSFTQGITTGSSFATAPPMKSFGGSFSAPVDGFVECCKISEAEKNLTARGIATEFDPTDKERKPPPRLTMSIPRGSFNGRNDLRSFLMQPGSKTSQVLCIIQRERSSTKVFPKYKLLLDDGNRFLTSARKRKKSRSSNYVISTDEEDLSRQGGHFFGKLRSNFVGTEFSIFDNGVRAGKSDKYPGVRPRQELACVAYQYNVLGTRGPRKMNAMVPALDDNNNAFETFNDERSMLERSKSGKGSNIVCMYNKPPKWNEQLNAYCLNFNGRVTEASVKNFQLICHDNPEYVILQFGKIGKDTFTMDYRWPMNALQAFGICLSSFDNKLACE